MPVKILADENIDSNIISNLRGSSYNIFSISEEKSGISDLEVIEFASINGYLILTEDKDFGEWVYSHHEKRVGIVLLRYHFTELAKITSNIKLVLDKYDESLYNSFTVITVNKIRIRKI